MRRHEVDERRRRPVLITDGETRAALATTRSLGRAGFPVHVSAHGGRSLAGASRHCRSEHETRDPEIDPIGWAEDVIELSNRLGASLFPMSEVALGSLFAASADVRADLVGPTRADYEAAIDKHTLLERAKAIGVDVPQSALIPALSALGDLPPGFAYPVVLKPRRSRVLFAGRWVAPPIDIVRTREDLQGAAQRWRPEFGDYLLQAFVPGSGEGLFALCRDGELVARFAHRRLREKPPLGGVSVLRESIAIADDLATASERLLRTLRFSGLAMVEFRRSRDGRLCLMEINPRPWGSLQLAIDAGVDFPRLWVELREGDSGARPDAMARIGVRTRWLLGDLDHWLACARSRSLRRELGTNLARLTLDFVRSFFDGTRLEVLRPEDPGPFAVELRQWIASLFRSLSGARGGRS